MTENQAETVNTLTEERYEGLKEKDTFEVNEKLTARLYIDSEGKEYIGLEHFALQDTEIDEVLITKETFLKVAQKAKYWF